MSELLVLMPLASIQIDPGVALGSGLGVMSIVIAIVIWLASTHAAHVAEADSNPNAYLRKVDAEAYERARQIYEAAIDQLEDELHRLAEQARDLQLEVQRLNSELVRVRRKGHRHDDTDSDITAITPPDAG
jgi:uncharacterized protein YlxW (UPF0749 family)